MKKHSTIFLFLLIPSFVIAQICDKIQLSKKFTNSMPQLHSIAVNDNCQAMAVWVESNSGWGGTGDPLIGAFYNNGTWIDPVQIQMDTSKGVIGTQELAVDINNNGDAAVAWINSTDGKVYFSYFKSGAWSAEKEVTVDSLPISVITTLRDDKLINVIYSNAVTLQGLPDFIKSTISTDEGASWPTQTTVGDNVPVPLCCDWQLAKSDNKKIAISWLEGVAPNRKLQLRAFDGTMLSNVQTIVIESDDCRLGFFNSHSIAINNTNNIAAGWLCGVVVVGSANQEITQVSFFNTSDVSLPIPTSLPSNITTDDVFFQKMTLNNANRALFVWNSLLDFLPRSPLVAFSAQFIPSTQEWETIISRPKLFASDRFVICNNDNGDAVSFFSSPPPLTFSTKYAFFLGNTDRWKSSNDLFSDEFIAGNPSDPANTDAPWAFDCKHGSSNLALITPSLNTLVCCEPFSAAQPTNFIGSCNFNQFPFQGEFFAPLQWSAPTGGGTVAGYNVYQNIELIASLPPTQTSFTAHNVPPNMENVYDVSAVDNNGIVGFPAEIVLNCTQ